MVSFVTHILDVFYNDDRLTFSSAWEAVAASSVRNALEAAVAQFPGELAKAAGGASALMCALPLEQLRDPLLNRREGSILPILLGEKLFTSVELETAHHTALARVNEQFLAAAVDSATTYKVQQELQVGARAEQ
jgi:hypothetical protein